MKELIIEHFKSVGLNPNQKGYLKTNQENLVDNFPNWAEIQKELGQGQGSELIPDKNGIMKFNAVHSSSALCVNNFAPFKLQREKFVFLNQSGFTEAAFEKKLSTGISTPNLDFYLESKYLIIGIESKFIETCSKKLPNYKGSLEKYNDRKELDYLPEGFSSVIKKYIRGKRIMHLDVSQLIKHSIALIRRGVEKFRIDQTVYMPGILPGFNRNKYAFLQAQTLPQFVY